MARLGDAFFKSPTRGFVKRSVHGYQGVRSPVSWSPVKAKPDGKRQAAGTSG